MLNLLLTHLSITNKTIGLVMIEKIQVCRGQDVELMMRSCLKILEGRLVQLTTQEHHLQKKRCASKELIEAYANSK